MVVYVVVYVAKWVYGLFRRPVIENKRDGEEPPSANGSNVCEKGT